MYEANKTNIVDRILNCDYVISPKYLASELHLHVFNYMHSSDKNPFDSASPLTMLKNPLWNLVTRRKLLKNQLKLDCILDWNTDEKVKEEKQRHEWLASNVLCALVNECSLMQLPSSKVSR